MSQQESESTKAIAIELALENLLRSGQATPENIHAAVLEVIDIYKENQ